MDSMTAEQFKRKYADTHVELSALTRLEQGRANGSLIKNSAGDKNIRTRGKLPGKNIIEKKGMDKRSGEYREFLLDAVSVRGNEFLDPSLMPIDKLATLALKACPQQVESKVEASFTFADMVKKASVELRGIDTMDLEDGEIDDS